MTQGSDNHSNWDSHSKLSQLEIPCHDLKRQLKILFIRFYRSMFAVFGGAIIYMKHWFEHKKHTRYPEKFMFDHYTGLVNVSLDALGNKACVTYIINVAGGATYYANSVCTMFKLEYMRPRPC